MKKKENNIGKWKAWTYIEDFVPHVYVVGAVPVDEVKSVFRLNIAQPQGKNPEELILNLNPEKINPNGKENALVGPFEFISECKNVLISISNIGMMDIIPIEKRSRAEIVNNKELRQIVLTNSSKLKKIIASYSTIANYNQIDLKVIIKNNYVYEGLKIGLAEDIYAAWPTKIDETEIVNELFDTLKTAQNILDTYNINGDESYIL